LALSCCIVEGSSYLPCGLLEINMYEVYSDNYLDVPPSVINCLITSVARNRDVDSGLCEGYYSGEVIDFKKQYIQGGRIVSHFS